MNLKQLLDRKPAIHHAYPLKDSGDVFAMSAVAQIESKDIDETQMTIRHVISSARRDRAGDELNSRGCDITEYRKNPIVQYEHGALLLPVGKAEDSEGRCTIEILPDRILSTTWFSRTFPDAAAVFALYAEKILRAWSVGFRPLEEPTRLEKSEGELESGFGFSRWELLEYSAVKVGCNQDAVGLRSLLSRGKIAGEKFSPELVKSLEPLAAPLRAWSPGMGKGFVQQRIERMEAMSHKWRKAKKEKPIDVTSAETPKGVKEEIVITKDPMGNTSGEAGGYAVSDEVPEHSTHEPMREVAKKYKMEGDEALHCNCDKSMVHHQHKADADPDYLKGVVTDLQTVDGISGVTQSPYKPEGEGYTQVHPKSTMDTIADGDADPNKAVGHWSRDHFTYGLLIRDIVNGTLNAPPFVISKEQKETLQECVSRKIPIITHENPDMKPDQVQAIAYSMCGEKLFAAPVTKDDDDTALKPADQGPTVGGDSASLPHGAAVFQHIIDVLESEATVAEPERQEDFATLLDTTRKIAKRCYPDIPFGGEGDEDGDQEPAPVKKKDPEAELEQQREEEDEAKEALDRYRGLDFVTIAQRAVDGSDRYLGVDIAACVERALEKPLSEIKASDTVIAEAIYAATGKRL